MMRFILWNDAEQRDEGGAGVEVAAQLYPAPESCSWHQIEGDLKTTTLALVEGELVEVARPMPLEGAKIVRRAEVDVLLASHLLPAIQTSIGIVQTDRDSRDVIENRSLRAERALRNGTPFTISWRLLDNSYSDPMDAEAMIAFADEVDAHFTTCIAASFAAKDAIDACATVEDVAAVDITTGFPAAP